MPNTCVYHRTSEDWRTCTHTSKHLRTIARTPENWWTCARTPRHLHTLGHNCEQACIPANTRTNHKRPVGEQACIPLNTCEHTPVSPGVSQNTCFYLRVPLNTCKHSPITLNTCEQAHVPLYCHRHHIQTYGLCWLPKVEVEVETCMCTQNPVNTHMYAHDYHIAEDAANMHVYTANNRVPGLERLATCPWPPTNLRAYPKTPDNSGVGLPLNTILSWLVFGKVPPTLIPDPGGPLKWQEGVSGSSMDTPKAPNHIFFRYENRP